MHTANPICPPQERIRLTCLLSACVKYCNQKQMLVVLSAITPLASPKVPGYDVSVGYNCSMTIFQVVFRALNELGTILPDVRSPRERSGERSGERSERKKS